MKLYPLRFEARLVPKIWGGRRLQSVLGKPLPEGEKIGESWEIYDRPDNSAVVAEGPLKGQSLGDLVKEFGPQLLGEASWAQNPDRFPLMAKFIDAADWLSVQVHPDDHWASSRLGPDENGKTEMWYVVATDGAGELMVGLKKGTDRASFRKALEQGKLEEVLKRVKVSPGDAVFLPAGRVHAIGAGCLVAEIQQNSDTTFRVYDFGRLENGKPRDLHLAEAFEAIDFKGPDGPLAELEDQQGQGWAFRDLARCEYFRVSLLQVQQRFRETPPSNCFHVLMGLEGNGTLEAAGCDSVSLEAGQSLLVPASLDFSLEGPCKVLWTRPGP